MNRHVPDFSGWMTYGDGRHLPLQKQDGNAYLYIISENEADKVLAVLASGEADAVPVRYVCNLTSFPFGFRDQEVPCITTNPTVSG